MFTCDYDFIEIGSRGYSWTSGCGKPILYMSPLGQGEAFPPLPTDNGAIFCTFCGKKIKLKTVKPIKQPTSRPVKPPPAPKPPRGGLHIDENHDTYDGWQGKGYQVQRGEKSIGRNTEGLALFHRNQTKEIPDRDDDCDDFAEPFSQYDRPF